MKTSGYRLEIQHAASDSSYVPHPFINFRMVIGSSASADIPLTDPDLYAVVTQNATGEVNIRIGRTGTPRSWKPGTTIELGKHHFRLVRFEAVGDNTESMTEGESPEPPPTLPPEMENRIRLTWQDTIDPQTTSEVILTNPRFAIGTASSNALVLESHKGISPVHAVLHVRGKGMFLVNQSSYGTKIMANGRTTRLMTEVDDRELLFDRDEFVIGRYQFRLDMSGSD